MHWWSDDGDVPGWWLWQEERVSDRWAHQWWSLWSVSCSVSSSWVSTPESTWHQDPGQHQSSPGHDQLWSRVTRNTALQPQDQRHWPAPGITVSTWHLPSHNKHLPVQKWRRSIKETNHFYVLVFVLFILDDDDDLAVMSPHSPWSTETKLFRSQHLLMINIYHGCWVEQKFSFIWKWKY